MGLNPNQRPFLLLPSEVVSALNIMCTLGQSAGYSGADWTKRFNHDLTSEDAAQSTLQPRLGFAKLPLVRSFTARGSHDVHKDLDLRKFYTDLASQIAYRYPNPGMPRAREGAIGGTWRHIREVQGYSGSRMCFIDGLVTLYDQDRFNGPPPPSARRSIHPPYAPTLREFAASKQTTFPTLDGDTERKISFVIFFRFNFVLQLYS
ncbi:hypothetical protein Btru_006006 [Bulinus truncatus]|nr:hypothetical protein Btru_006006 [Bulinus truncatus]